MSSQRRSRTVGPPCFPLTGWGGSFFDSREDGTRSANEPISSTEQMPIPYALRRARLTARVSATRISAPWTRGETLEGSACDDRHAARRGWHGISADGGSVGSAVGRPCRGDSTTIVTYPRKAAVVRPLRVAGALAGGINCTLALPHGSGAGSVCRPRWSLGPSAGGVWFRGIRMGVKRGGPWRRLADLPRRVTADCERALFVLRITGAFDRR